MLSGAGLVVEITCLVTLVNRTSSARETLGAYVSATYDARRLRELPRSVWQDRCRSDPELFVADDVVQLIHAYAQAAASASVTRRLSLLMDINRHDDPRVFAFLLRVLTDRREPLEMRSYTDRTAAKLSAWLVPVRSGGVRGSVVRYRHG